MAFRSMQLFQVDQALAIGTDGLHNLNGRIETVKGGKSLKPMELFMGKSWENHFQMVECSIAIVAYRRV
jgi:hypothetical protein